MATALTERETHHDFGKQWADWSAQITPERIDQAIEETRRLVGDLTGKSFIDIGSGSGLLSLAALTIGAKHVTAIDIDEDSTATTVAVLEQYAHRDDWTAKHLSVFDAEGRFDVVYSWGVLHHTGDMWRAIEKAASLANETFAFALYEKTPLCGLWRVEKRLYMRLPKWAQRAAARAYLFAYAAARRIAGKGRLTGEQPRGFTLDVGIHDWLGGYPYESTTLSEVDPFMWKLGFELVQHNPAPVHLWGAGGTGCSEYVYRKR